MLLYRAGECVTPLQYAFGRKLIEQCRDRALYEVLFFRAARSGPRGDRSVWLVHVWGSDNRGNLKEGASFVG